MSKNNFIENENNNLFKTKKESAIFIDGINSLVIRRLLITRDKFTGKIISKTVLQEHSYPLSKISEEELFQKRLSGTPGFVLKIGESLYYKKFQKNVT